MQKNYLIKDIIFIFLIISAPFLFFLYLFAPDQSSIYLYGLVIDSGYYDSIYVLSWYAVNYFLAFTLYSIWFITCKSWWRYSILVLIYLEIRKLSLMIDDTNQLTYSELSIFLNGLCIVLILLIISKKLNYYSFSKSINLQLDEEIETLLDNVSNFNKKQYKGFKHRLFQLRKEKKSLDKKVYLTRLIKLREEFFIDEDEKENDLIF